MAITIHRLWYRLRATPPSGYVNVGDMFKTGYTSPNIDTLDKNKKILFVINDNNVICKPDNYNELWNESGSGGKQDICIYKPVCNNNDYVSLGYIACVDSNRDKPHSVQVYNVHKKYIEYNNEYTKNDRIWTDQGSNTDYHIEVYNSSEYHTFTITTSKAIKAWGLRCGQLDSDYKLPNNNTKYTIKYNYQATILYC